MEVEFLSLQAKVVANTFAEIEDLNDQLHYNPAMSVDDCISSFRHLASRSF
jgi:hypothetical protein